MVPQGGGSEPYCERMNAVLCSKGRSSKLLEEDEPNHRGLINLSRNKKNLPQQSVVPSKKRKEKNDVLEYKDDVLVVGPHTNGVLF